MTLDQSIGNVAGPARGGRKTVFEIRTNYGKLWHQNGKIGEVR
jgi:hypothetical protein